MIDRLLFCSVFLCCAAPAWAVLDYTIVVQAPDSVRTLLLDNLEVANWKGNALLTPEQLAHSVQTAPAQARALLETQGYFNAQVQASLERAEDKPWRVLLNVVLGEPVHVSTVQIEVDGPIRDDPDYARRLRAITRNWGVPAGAAFTQVQWRESKNKALLGLSLRRYPAARLVDSTAQVDPVTQQVALAVRYDSGPAFTLGPVVVHGLKHYPASIVEHLAPFKPGAEYTQKNLLDLQSSLASTPYFTSSYVHAVVDPAAPESVPVQVEVKEAPQQKLGFGLGYSTDTGQRAEISHQYYNLLQRGWILNSGVRIEQLQQSAGVQLTLPASAEGYVVGGFARWEHSDVQNLESSLYRQGATLTRQRNDILSTQGLQYVNQRTQPDGDVATQTQALILSTSWTLRAYDNPTNPRRGYAWRVDLSGAQGRILSDTSFIRAYSKGQLYVPISSRWGRFLLRAEGGQVFAGDGNAVPNDSLFQTGGATTVRGYAFNSIGVPVGNNAIEGGRMLGVGSVEYQYPVRPNWYAAVFTDAGDVTNRWQDFKPQMGYGIGARWISPVGPLALDVAYGETVQRWRLHVSFDVNF